MGLGKNGVDWEGMALHDNSRYKEIRRVLSTELDDDIVNIEDEELEYDFIGVVDGESSVLGALDFEMLRSSFEKVLSTLTEREARVLKLKFGLTDRGELNYTEIGEMFGLSGSMISMIARRGLNKMRHPLRSKLIKHHWSEIN